MQSGTGVSRMPSESVFCGLVLRRAGGASAGHRPTKVCDWVRVRRPRSRASGKHIAKTGLIFAIFQMSSNFFQIFRSIVVSFLSYHLSRSLRPVFGKTIEKHVSRLQKTKKKSNNLYKNTFLKKIGGILTSLVCFCLNFQSSSGSARPLHRRDHPINLSPLTILAFSD